MVEEAAATVQLLVVRPRAPIQFLARKMLAYLGIQKNHQKVYQMTLDLYRHLVHKAMAAALEDSMALELALQAVYILPVADIPGHNMGDSTFLDP
ncbi:MAG: hypothetical protein GOVbin152_6 [Prokaryotic dsDNA virus sp.]|nr:MAG: hypothetical protein GOVbin152_6 [Prokaryotic dsDNA virus sp.]